MATLTGVAGSSAVRTVQLAAKVAGVDVALKADPNADPKTPVLSHTKMTVTGTHTIMQFLAQQGNAKHLLGATPEEEAQVADWLSKSRLDLSSGSMNALQSLNDSLKTSAVLVGYKLSIADLAVFGAVFEAVTKLKPGEKRGLVNLLRWVDFVQNVAGAKEFFGEEVAIEKKEFVPPPPPEPAKAGPAGDKGKGGDKAAADGKGGKAAAPATPAAAEGGKGEKKGKGDAAKPKEGAAADAGKGGEKKKGGDAAAAAAGGEGKKGKEKGEGKAKEGGGDKAPAAKAEITVQALDIRVGTIVKVWPHPSADGLWCEEIELGEAKPRQVVSGLRKFVPEERMLGAKVLVVVNVKPGNLRDVRSEGLVLCASNADHTDVDFVNPPPGVPNGEKVAFAGYDGPPDERLDSKKKQLEVVFPFLATDAEGVAKYKDVPFTTSKGVCTARLRNSHVK